ncbi:V-type ATP synthase subunit E [Candidatus Epulonipiscium viviparus]|uniref:V-type ATP synthase subunit E n=1 Tax=Candidatus Epulonipiscium viviparus TaxID=420336 RepID=UPI00016C0300|nr:V-type ATP synthase subunit E family protein [Candidatus Epulopiscium viviparus]
MVTLEQKLALFSKLMQQDISDNLQEGRAKIESDYRKRRALQEQQSKEKAKRYVDDHKKIIDTKIAQYKAKAKLESKKEIMQVKEDCIHVIDELLKDRINEYTDTAEYQTWIIESVKSLKEYFDQEVVIYLSPKDLKNQKEAIINELEAEGANTKFVAFDLNDKIVLGGLIVKIEASNMQIDLSLDSVLENKSEEISQLVLTAIEKECEELEK